MAEERKDPNALLKLDQQRVHFLSEGALDPIEAIQKYSHCVIVGDPGAGKTTLLKYLTLKCVDGLTSNLQGVPIHIELNAFAVADQSDLLKFVSTVWENRYNFPADEALKYIKDKLESGQAILFLDGLDETVVGKTKEESEDTYARMVGAITNIAVKYHTCPIIVTVRKAGYFQRKRLDGFTELEILEFSPQDIENFVNKWFSRYQTDEKRNQAKELNNLLKRNPRIHVLASNPLLLSLIAIVYEAELDLPDRRSELYKQCADIMLAKWDASRNIKRRREFKPLYKRQLLQEVAWHFHQQGRRYFPEEELMEIIERFLPTVGLSKDQSRDILDEIANENGLLKEQARHWHGFIHLTLQEYFVAQYAVENNKLSNLLEQRRAPWWREVILLYAGLVSDASPLLENLLMYHPKQQSHFDLRLTDEIILAGHCLATHPTVRKSVLRNEIISLLAPALSFTNSPEIMQDLAQSLAEIGGKDAYTLILKIISSNNIDRLNRQYILYALRDRGERIVVPDLLDLLLDKQIDIDTLLTTAYVIGIMGDRSVIPTLFQMLCNPKTNFSLCRNIYFALNNIDAKELRANLNHLFNDSSVDQLVKIHVSHVLQSKNNVNYNPLYEQERI
jgi:predicted NACHT family NTPase